MNFFSFLFGRGNGGKKADSTYLLSEDAKRAAAWIETTNPLRGMTASRMQALYDASRNGDTVHLQWLYNEIEKSDPTLLICASRRRGALASLDWSVKTRSENRMRNFDKVLAEEQAKAVEAAFGEAELGGFNDAMEHLAGAFFRGFAHVLPKWSADGLVIEGFETLDNWNFVRDLMTGTWYWNPEANAYTDYGSCRPIPQGELLTMVTPYHIDYPMLTIYLRQAVGEKGWAKFTERFGIPPVILTMPSDIPSDQVEMWRAQAEKVAEGGSGAVPAGTQVNFCDGARGINPFKDFIHNQRELTVLMATGGLLTSLAQSGSGTLAGGAHSDTWAEVRRMDSAKIASALNAQIVKPLLSRAFPEKRSSSTSTLIPRRHPAPAKSSKMPLRRETRAISSTKLNLKKRQGISL
jgi:phage gp29-like protein